MNPSSLNIEEFSKKSADFYKEIQPEVEASYRGKYAAIDFESRKYWIGETLSDALKNAKAEFPNKLFYVVQVGSSAIFSIQSVTKKSARFSKSHGPQWIY